MRVIDSHESHTKITMPVEGNTQIAGILHGGATAALCETAASIAATAHAERLMGSGKPGLGLVAVGTELSVSHLRAAHTGTVTATTEALHLGKTSTVHLVKVTDGQDRVVSTALATNRIIETR